MKGRSGRFTRRALFVACMPAIPAVAQQALQNMVSEDQAALSRSQHMQSTESGDYTFKSGDFRMMVSPSVALQYNDNVNLAQTNALDDYIVMPLVGVTASYPLTQQNLLYLDFSVGYNWYLKNPSFSSLSVNSMSGTGLSFDMVVKDLTINLHDQVNYTEGVGQQGGGPTLSYNSGTANVANTATFGTFQNTVGLLGTWDLNQVKLSLGYDHQNIISTSGQFNNIDHSAEIVMARAGFQLHPQVTAGMEATAAFTRYDQQILNNNNQYTVGPYVEYRPGKFFTLTARGGYSYSQFDQTSALIKTSSQGSWYANLSISHAVTDFLTYSFDVGREVQLGAVSDLEEDWYIRPNCTLTIINGLTLSPYFFYEHGNQGTGSTGSIPGYLNGAFDYYGGGITLSHAITGRLSGSLSYQYMSHSSATPNSTYTQNLVALQITYHL